MGLGLDYCGTEEGGRPGGPEGGDNGGDEEAWGASAGMKSSSACSGSSPPLLSRSASYNGTTPRCFALEHAWKLATNEMTTALSLSLHLFGKLFFTNMNMFEHVFH